MSVKEIMQEIRDGLSGEYGVDMAYLEGQVTKYKNHENAADIESQIAELAYEILPDEKKEQVARMMYLDGKRLDAVMNEAIQLINEGKHEEAFKLTEGLYTKIRISYRETEEKMYLSLRNPLEHQLYLYFYQPSKRLERPPFDLSRMVMLHGFSLLEAGRAEEAVSVLEDAIRFNPLNTDAYFEMAECFKYMKQNDDLLGCTKETLSIATSPEEISRCYCNLGFYCVEIEDYDSAVCFYYEAMVYADNPIVTAELHHIHNITKKKLSPPTRKLVNAAFEKYGIKPGANEEVVSVVAALAKGSYEENDILRAKIYFRILYSLTNDPDVKKTIDQLAKIK
ncbi:MAG: tetratricopeptide repeat protein [Ruminococcus sp.]|nr:tetratricopeptide repeat protein [Ruminococcus sp.]